MYNADSSNDPCSSISSVERPWMPLQTICFLPVLLKSAGFQESLENPSLSCDYFFQYNHFNRTNWLVEYLIILIPSTTILAMSHHKFIFILYTMGYSLVENILYQQFSWISWCILITEWLYEANKCCQFSTDNIVSFLCRVLLKESWNVVAYWYWQML